MAFWRTHFTWLVNKPTRQFDGHTSRVCYTRPRLRWRLTYDARLRRTLHSKHAKPAHLDPPSTETTEHLKAWNGQDVALYAYAKELFDELKLACGVV